MKLTSLSGLDMNRLEYGEHLRPFRDWMIMLAVFAALLLMSALWSAWVFYRAWTGESVGAETPAAPVKTDEIEAVKRVFEIRAIEESRYGGEYHFVDPA